MVSSKNQLENILLYRHLSTFLLNFILDFIQQYEEAAMPYNNLIKERKFDDETDRAFTAAWNRGETYEQLCEQFNITSPTVAKWRQRLSLSPRSTRVHHFEDTGPKSKELGLLELGSNTCRWPTSGTSGVDFRFCGHKTVPNSSYCQHHERKSKGGLQD